MSLCATVLRRGFALVLMLQVTAATYNGRLECGPYGFTCEGKSKLRLCEGDGVRGPAFLCPPGTLCNEESSAVCEDLYSYMEPALNAVRCRRHERIADPSVAGCKGYILCIPNKERFQGIKFTCTGDTVFNGVTRSCSAPHRYRCPLPLNTTTEQADLSQRERGAGWPLNARPIDCKDYKLSVRGPTTSTAAAAYFCPKQPRAGPLRCTVFSDHFCLILERDDRDQFTGQPYRRPR